MLIDRIGVPAMLEQTAEECAELAHACLKKARYLRNDNPTYKNGSLISDFECSYGEAELNAALSEEMADLFICWSELMIGEVVTLDELQDWVDKKIDRMRKRWEFFDKLKNERESVKGDMA